MGKSFLTLVLFVVASVCPRLDAGPIYPDCIPSTLQGYIDSSACVLGGGSYIVGFAFPQPLNPNGAAVLDASQIELTPEPNGLGGSFEFAVVNGSFSAPAGDTITYDIDYILLLAPDSIFGGASLILDPSGNVSVTESICADSFFGAISGATVCEANTPDGVVDSAPQLVSVNDGNPPLSLSDSITLSPAAYSYANVEMAIVLTGGIGGAASGGVNVSVEALADNPTVPEPGTSLLCLGGLTAIGIFRRSVTRLNARPGVHFDLRGQ
jgi:hypothetical protein